MEADSFLQQIDTMVPKRINVSAEKRFHGFSEFLKDQGIKKKNYVEAQAHLSSCMLLYFYFIYLFHLDKFLILSSISPTSMMTLHGD